MNFNAILQEYRVAYLVIGEKGGGVWQEVGDRKGLRSAHLVEDLVDRATPAMTYDFVAGKLGPRLASQGAVTAVTSNNESCVWVFFFESEAPVREKVSFARTVDEVIRGELG